MIHRRRALLGLGAALFAPALIRTPGLLMPVKAPAEGMAGEWGPGPPAAAPSDFPNGVFEFRMFRMTGQGFTRARSYVDAGGRFVTVFL